MNFGRDDIPAEVLDAMAAERRRLQRLRHWCPECMGRTGKGSPCYEPEEEPATEEQQ